MGLRSGGKRGMKEGLPEDGNFSLILETIGWGWCGVFPDQTGFLQMWGDPIRWKSAPRAVKELT